MIWLVLGIVVLLAVVLPGVWVRHVLNKYSEPADRYRAQGSGAELARHLLDRFELQHVKVEATDQGDHYAPADAAVRLSQKNYAGYSLTAITVAAHEVGHALQHARGEALFNARQTIVRYAALGEAAARVLLIGAPLMLALTRVPQVGLSMLVLGVAALLLGTLAHLVTLPVEFDASYGKALPILAAGDYLHDGDLPHARRLLKAAALTYVAASLASLLNVGRWIAVLRR
jgi:Zn-dependent membrane protease YugP